MSEELIYTSSPEGLKAGRSGYCTVAATSGIAPPLFDLLEGLSGYTPVYPTHQENARASPVVYSHIAYTLAGRPLSVLSRVAYAGLDYSNRNNKLAHHLVLDVGERPVGGPAWLLGRDGVMKTAWDGKVRPIPAGPQTPRGDRPPSRCDRWREAAGDAGWAGALVEAFLHDPGRLVYLVYEPGGGVDVLGLFEEAIALLPAERRWGVTFSTYFTQAPPGGLNCQWRAVLRGSAAHAQAADLRPRPAAVLELGPGAPGSNGNPGTGRHVHFAREGEWPAPETPAEAPAPPAPEPVHPAAPETPAQQPTPSHSLARTASHDVPVALPAPSDHGVASKPGGSSTQRSTAAAKRHPQGPPTRAAGHATGDTSSVDSIDWNQDAEAPAPLAYEMEAGTRLHSLLIAGLVLALVGVFVTAYLSLGPSRDRVNARATAARRNPPARRGTPPGPASPKPTLAAAPAVEPPEPAASPEAEPTSPPPEPTPKPEPKPEPAPVEEPGRLATIVPPDQPNGAGPNAAAPPPSPAPSPPPAPPPSPAPPPLLTSRPEPALPKPAPPVTSPMKPERVFAAKALPDPAKKGGKESSDPVLLKLDAPGPVQLDLIGLNEKRMKKSVVKRLSAGGSGTDLALLGAADDHPIATFRPEGGAIRFRWAAVNPSAKVDYATLSDCVLTVKEPRKTTDLLLRGRVVRPQWCRISSNHVELRWGSTPPPSVAPVVAELEFDPAGKPEITEVRKLPKKKGGLFEVVLKDGEKFHVDFQIQSDVKGANLELKLPSRELNLPGFANKKQPYLLLREVQIERDIQMEKIQKLGGDPSRTADDLLEWAQKDVRSTRSTVEDYLRCRRVIDDANGLKNLDFRFKLAHPYGDGTYVIYSTFEDETVTGG